MESENGNGQGRRPLTRGDTPPAGRGLPQKIKGQTTVLIAFSIVVLIAVVGLAVDGGSMYAQRRNAQNAADSIALGATSDMMTVYNANNGDDGTPGQEQTISNTLTTLASAHGISRSNIHAYYVNDNKQIVGGAEVGYYGGIPFSQGAKGIVVKGYSQTNAFFMKLFGWDSVGASADSTAFLGVVSSLDGNQTDMDAGLFPVGFFTDTHHLNNLIPGNEYTLINQDPRRPGNWGYVGFNGNNTPHVNDAWQACGYNPSIRDDTQWSQYCTNPDYSGQSGASGPTLYNTGWPDPAGNDQTAYGLHWGEGADGWWIPGDPGKSTQQCRNLSRLAVGQEFLVPVFDDTAGTGNNARFHLIGLAWFRITNSEVECNGSHLEIDGIFERKFVSGASGRHGDIEHSSSVTVFLDN